MLSISALYLVLASWTANHAASLNDLSSSVPTSVTKPIFRPLPLGAWLPPPPVQAAVPSARATSRVRPRKRVRMLPPPVSTTAAHRPKIGDIRVGNRLPEGEPLIRHRNGWANRGASQNALRRTDRRLP